jgi:hypothetical protein
MKQTKAERSLFMLCPKCRTNVDDRASFCPVCGTPLYRGPSRMGYRAPISHRSIALAIVLSLVTLGIYGLYWMYCLVRDLSAASGDDSGFGGGAVVLLGIVTGGLYWLYWYYKAGGKVNRIHYLDGRPQDGSLGILYLLLALFGFSIVSMALIQNELNKVAAD